MTAPATHKICRLCGKDSASGPRVKDQTGRYFCRPCYDRAIERKRLREARSAATAPPPSVARQRPNPLMSSNGIAGSLPAAHAPLLPSAVSSNANDVDRRELVARADVPEPSTFELEPEVEAAPAPAAFLSNAPAAPLGCENGVIDVPRVQSARLTLLDDEPPPVAFTACLHCRRPLPTGAIVCLACGYNMLSGELLPHETDRPLAGLRPRGGWTGPLLIGAGLMALALGGGYLLSGTWQGLVIFAVAMAVALPAWFAWALVDARNTERAQVMIWLVPGYIFAWIFGQSRSRYLRAVTVGMVAIAIVFAVMGYHWRALERQRMRALIDERAAASLPG